MVKVEELGVLKVPVPGVGLAAGLTPLDQLPVEENAHPQLPDGGGTEPARAAGVEIHIGIDVVPGKDTRLVQFLPEEYLMGGEMQKLGHGIAPQPGILVQQLGLPHAVVLKDDVQTHGVGEGHLGLTGEGLARRAVGPESEAGNAVIHLEPGGHSLLKGPGHRPEGESDHVAGRVGGFDLGAVVGGQVVLGLEDFLHPA